MIAAGLFAVLAVLSWKNTPLFRVSLLLSLIHILEFLFYEPADHGAFAFIYEAALCLGIVLFTLYNTQAPWAIALSGIMLLSIVLILVEFIDYFMFNSTLELIYLMWIDITTAIELAIIALAYNGIFKYNASSNRGSGRDNNNRSIYSMGA